jgi:hypothetical protein
MATTRGASKSDAQVKQDFLASVTHGLRKTIEANITIHGQTGFAVDAGLELRNRSYGRGAGFYEIAMSAVEEVVAEYRSAGWLVECEKYKGQYGVQEAKLRFQ